MFSIFYSVESVKCRCLYIQYNRYITFFCPCSFGFFPRKSQRRPGLSSVVNERSPLMVSLLPSPKELSPHLFLGGPARRQSPLQAELSDTKALMEELNQQLPSVRWCKTSQDTSHVTLFFSFDQGYHVSFSLLPFPKHQLLAAMDTYDHKGAEIFQNKLTETYR